MCAGHGADTAGWEDLGRYLVWWQSQLGHRGKKPLTLRPYISASGKLPSCRPAVTKRFMSPVRSTNRCAVTPASPLLRKLREEGEAASEGETGNEDHTQVLAELSTHMEKSPRPQVIPVEAESRRSRPGVEERQAQVSCIITVGERQTTFKPGEMEEDQGKEPL